MDLNRRSKEWWAWRTLWLIVGVGGIMTAPLWGQHAWFQDYFNQPDFKTPPNISKHVFNFFHHSSGGNLLNDGLDRKLRDLGYKVHTRIQTQYEYENNYTDYRHWYKRFQRELGIRLNDHYYRFEGPDATGQPKTGEQIDDNYRDFMLNYYDFNAERMDIIMFKPCYPGSDVSSYDTEYDQTTRNNGYGKVTKGTPNADNHQNNFLYLNSGASVDAAYDTRYWSAGQWNSASASLAQLKCAYRGMLNIFAAHPDILFIAMQAPPMIGLSAEQSAHCRELARWFREDWLHQYDPKGTDNFQDYPFTNVVPFDFHNAIAWTGNDTRLDLAYFWFPQGGFPDNTLDTTNPHKLGESANAGGDNHPEVWLNQRTATIFGGGVDTFSPAHTGQPGRTYSAWINAVVNRWEKNKVLVVELSKFSCHYQATSNSVRLEWVTASEQNNYGFQIQKKAAAETEWRPLGFIAGTGTSVKPVTYQYTDRQLAFGVFQYRLEQIDFDGSRAYSDILTVTITPPLELKLYGNYPNPFNGVTTIRYTLPRTTWVAGEILNAQGQSVKRLESEYQTAGAHEIQWDATDAALTPVSTGVYYLVLRTENFETFHKMLLLR
ncbi:T9SS type A sorting domain-containing protein [candidate division KSB1 bacterium]|nr:T9SS type A sorting domain-containing protein [candidate division KSB1 bacterium]